MKSQDLAALAQQALRDGLAAARLFGPNPEAGLPAAFAAVQPPVGRARNAGVAMGVVFAAASMLAYWRFVSVFGGGPGVGQLLKAFLLGLVYFASLAGALALARVILQGRGEVGAVVFAAGAAALPLAGWALASAVVGFVNFEVILVLGVFAFCWTVLLVHSACAQLLKLSERRATISIPMVLLLTNWFCKVLFTSLLM